MDGNVHFHSWPVALRRLFLYSFMTIIAGVLLLPAHSTGVYDFCADGGAGIELAVSHPVGPIVQQPVSMDTGTATRRGPDASRLPAVKVKTGYHVLIHQAGQRHGVESALIKAIIMAESSYNPRAVSNRGAAGLMQLMPTTATSMGVKDRFDPVHNIDGGVRYFKKMLVRFDGDTRLALAAYNAGAQKVRRYNGIPPYKTTRTYIDKVFQYYERYKDLENNASSAV